MITLAVIIGLAAALYLYLTRTFDYWQKRGVKHDKPWPLFGTNAKNFFMQATIVQVASETYRKYPGEKLVGFYRSSNPELLIRDPALAKSIFTTDFSSFHRRGILPGDVEPEPLQMHQFVVDDDLWRLMRIRMTPAFSSGKLKAMFPLIVDRAERLQARLQRVGGKEAVEARDLMARYTTDVIGTVGFGIISDSLNDDNDAFRALGRKIFSFSSSKLFKLFLKNLLPRIFGYLKAFSGEIEGDVVGMVKSIMQQRNYEPCGRHDFIDLLLECKKKGAMSGESIVETNADSSPKKVSFEMNDEIMAAQCFVFFVAGFETSSSATSFTLHELAHNQGAQRKAQEEIDRVLAKHNNKLCYDAISEMTYLRWCLNEALRKYPPLGFLQRKCARTHTFPEINVTVDPGVKVIIPIEAYHNDPEIFPEPQEFRPERFDPEVITPQQKVAYLPFGEGLRNCIGERLGLMQSMAGLAAVLAQCTVTPVPGRARKLKFDKISVITNPVDGVPLIFQQRKVQ
ncbi:cytochrome P450 6a2-like [Choristoneura fumiferana]|uniref:cytochrome P450 6a2-like n=1 Tax=Choristoneura fumiferana TaxID=7141 RepID=UPI003D15373D